MQTPFKASSPSLLRDNPRETVPRSEFIGAACSSWNPKISISTHTSLSKQSLKTTRAGEIGLISTHREVTYFCAYCNPQGLEQRRHRIGTETELSDFSGEKHQGRLLQKGEETTAIPRNSIRANDSDMGTNGDIDTTGSPWIDLSHMTSLPHIQGSQSKTTFLQ